MKIKVGAILTGLFLIMAGLAGCMGINQAEKPSAGVPGGGEPPLNPPVAAVAPVVEPTQAADSEQWFVQGLQLYEKNRYLEAASAFDQAIAANADNYKVYTAKGIALCFAGEYQPGMKLIQKTLAMKPDYLPAFYDLAMAYKLQRDYDQSLFWFEKTIQGDPGNTWSYYGAATIYADRGDPRNAMAYLRKAISLDPGVKEAARTQAHFDQMRYLPEFQALVK